MSKRLPKLRQSDFMTIDAWEKAKEQRKIEQYVARELAKMRRKARKEALEKRVPNIRLKSLQDLKAVPDSIKEILSNMEAGNEVAIELPSEYKVKTLPKLKEVYNMAAYEGSRRGKSPKYTPRKLGQKVDGYFISCEKKEKPPTITGLMLWLGLQRETFYYYLGHPQFGPIMMYARDRIENWLEEKLITTKNNPTGIIFALKNRHGWKDVQTTEVNYSNLTEQELLARLQALAPQLIELTNQQQIEHKVEEAVYEVDESDTEPVVRSVIAVGSEQ